MCTHNANQMQICWQKVLFCTQNANKMLICGHKLAICEHKILIYWTNLLLLLRLFHLYHLSCRDFKNGCQILPNCAGFFS